MAFNFNWSPLIADTSRARDMLTSALNKSPKPPIIVDDIIVTELNLGGVPPELEILEIGDLAEDRFRGIFKMQYSGDAFLTLRTRIQANPLNTYLSTKPDFASPRPLAAATGLTIPLQITLSDIRLSGFVILVFSRQKGITLVFRNDPLESLKVSSTFDSIPFVRDYLQRQIEGQIRILFMEHLPAIIHRLSLRLWVKDHPTQASINSNELEDPVERRNQKPVDPLATPSQPPADASGRPLDESESVFLLDDQNGMSTTFSQKNLLRLAALTDSNRSLSLFTPTISDAVFRAWAGAAEGRDLHRPPPHQMHGASGFTLAALSRLGSAAPSKASSVYSFTSDPGAQLPSSVSPSALSRPSSSSHVSMNTYSMSGTLTGGRSRLHGQRKRKHRVVNLRKSTPPDEAQENGAAGASKPPSRPSTPHSSSNAPSSSWATSSEHEGELQTPPDSPEKKAKQIADNSKTPLARPLDAIPTLDAEQAPPITPMQRPSLRAIPPMTTSLSDTPSSSQSRPALSPSPSVYKGRPISPQHHLFASPSSASLPSYSPARPRSVQDEPVSPSPSGSGTNTTAPFPYIAGSNSGGILEQAWLMKMKNEVSRRAAAERERSGSVASMGPGTAGSARKGSDAGQNDEPDGPPPPAYVA